MTSGKTTKKSKTPTTIKETEKVKFAVIETGGKQYLIQPGEKLLVEKIEKPKKGKTITFDKVLLLIKGESIKIGKPYLSKVKIESTWLGEKKGKKITVLKYKPKTRYRKKRGHRQIYTEVLIGDF